MAKRNKLCLPIPTIFAFGMKFDWRPPHDPFSRPRESLIGKCSFLIWHTARAIASRAGRFLLRAQYRRPVMTWTCAATFRPSQSVACIALPTSSSRDVYALAPYICRPLRDDTQDC